MNEQDENAQAAAAALETECRTLQTELAAERSATERLRAERDHFEQRILETERALAPRLKSLLTFAPMRFVLREWARIKAGGKPWRPLQLDTQPGASPVAAQIAEEHAPDLPEAVKSEAGRRSLEPVACHATGLGIAVFAFDRAESLAIVLQALTLQGAAPFVHVFIDGDQGRPSKRAEIDLVEKCARAFPVKAVHRNKGHFGFRKMMLLSMKYMMERYEKILFLEDDCFPARGAVAAFDKALQEIEGKDDVFSVYGHHFRVPGEADGLARFQGWGWATSAAKLRPVWKDLMECYLMTEEDYLAFVEEKMTPEIVSRIDVTPGRQPTDTIRRFFAWDETLCLLTALRGMRHMPTPSRVIYNFGAGGGASHFHDVEFYRKPPFNMVAKDELWDLYDATGDAA